MKKFLSFLFVAIMISTVSFGQSRLVGVQSTSEGNALSEQDRALTELTYVDAPIEVYLGLGATAPITVSGLTYYPASVISPLAGQTINKIAVNVDNSGGNTVSSLKVCIWTDTTGQCATPAYEQEIATVVKGWNEVELTTPYTLGSDSIFIGYKLVGVGYVCGFEKKATLAPDGYGDMLVMSSGTTHVGAISNLDAGDVGVKAWAGSLDAVDAQLISINSDTYVTVGEQDVKGTIKNNGTDPITSYDVTYKIDGGAASATYSVTGANITTDATAEFTHDVKANFSATGTYSLEVEISNVNGSGETNLADNKLTKEITVMNEIYKGVVVYEEGTGTWCGWCPRGHVGLNTMAHNVTDDTWIGIAAHYSDPMAISGYTSSLGFGGYPSGKMNRKKEVDPGIDELQDNYNEFLEVAPVAKIGFTEQTWDAVTRKFTVTVEVKFALDIADAKYNVALIVLEDSVKGTNSGYDQANYYAKNGIDLIDWDGTNWKDLGDPVPASQMVYNHVARQLLGGFAGVSDAIPAAVTYNTPYTHTFESSIASDSKAANTKYVAIVTNRTTGEIINGAEIKFGGTVGVEQTEEDNFVVYPNPTTGTLFVNNAINSTIIVYNMLGEEVYRTNADNNKTSIDMSEYSQGNYLVKVIKNNSVSTKKIILVK